MTVREIAEKAGVSVATVSRYLADKERVSSVYRQKIEKLLADHEDTALPRTRKKESQAALLLPFRRLQFYQHIVQVLMTQCPESGFQLVILPAFSAKRSGWFRTLQTLKPAGIIGLDSIVDEEVERWLKENPQTAMVILGDETTHENVSMVRINDLAAAYEGTRYLISLGHQRICFFTNHPYDISTSFQRLTGCRKAMDEVGVDIEPHVRYGALTYENGYELGAALVKERRDYTAVFAFSDEMALGAIAALREGGIRVPEDISVLGVDDLPIAERACPRLTTIHQPIEDMVRVTLELLRAAEPQSRAVSLPYRLVERDTCRKLTAES